MPESGYPIEVRQAAERIAGEWLREHGYCDCAVQQQRLAHRLLPVVGLFTREIRLGTRYGIEDMTARLAVYLTRTHDDLSRGLHRPGASAAASHVGWGYTRDGEAN